MRLDRRNLLKALGLTGSAYFLPSLLPTRRLRAATPTVPTRILFFYTPHGTLFRHWVRPPSGASMATETAYELGPILQPLQAFKNRLLLLEGMDFKSSYPDTVAPKNGHVGGQTHALSAIGRANASAAGGISIDQFIAQGINSPAPVTALPSLELSARFNSAIATYVTSWAGSNSLVPPMTDPMAVFTRMFPNGPPTATQPSDAQIAAAALAQRRKSILDGVLGEFNAVKQPLSTADKAKLDSHAALLRSLEARLTLPPIPTTCKAPDSKTLLTTFNADVKARAVANYVPDLVTAFTSLAVAAFACDITRVITFDIDGLDDSLFADNPAVATAGGTHPFLHGMDDIMWYANETFGAKNTIPAASMDPTNVATGVKYYASYAKFMATLLEQLDAITEPDGSTLLDHTLVVWCGEIGSSNHFNYMANYAIAGGGATGSLKTGRYLRLPRTSPPSTNEGYPNSGIPHNNLFVSLANAMGLAGVTSFGDPKICTGSLAQLKG